MKVIIIDTSTEKSVVLYKNSSGEVEKKSLPSGFQSSRHLIEALDIDFEGVELIGVTVGPGLMTGIRVGMAAAQGLALGLQIPLVGISSLEGFLLKPGQAAVIDAKIRGAYVQKWGEKPIFCAFEDLQSYLADCDLIVGPNLSRIDFANKIEQEPDAARMLEAVLRKLAARDFDLQAQYL